MNLILALEVEALAEAMALVRKAGIKGERLTEVLQSSMGRSALMDVKAPLILKNEYPASFPLRLMHKDIRLALELAKQEGIELPAGAAAFSTYSAVKAAARDDPDYAAVARFWNNRGDYKARARGTHIIPKRGDVGAVGADATRVHWQSKKLGLFDAEACIVQFSQAISFSRGEAVAQGSVHRTRRPIHLPALSYDMEEIVPISPVPHEALRIQCVGCSISAFGSINISTWL